MPRVWEEEAWLASDDGAKSAPLPSALGGRAMAMGEGMWANKVTRGVATRRATT